MAKSLIIIPTYNEKENIPRLISEIRKVGKFQVLIVDDNSPDGTGEIAKKLADQFGDIHVIERQKERGYGTACLAGFKYGLSHDYDYIFQMDADLSHNPQELPHFLEKIKGCDLLIGSRYVKGGKIIADWGIFRRFLSRGGNTFARFLLGLPAQDCTSGYRCYKRQVLENIPLDMIKSNGYSFLLEVLYESQKKGFAVAEIPITYVDREHGKSKLSRKVIGEAFFMVLRLGLRRILRPVG